MARWFPSNRTRVTRAPVRTTRLPGQAASHPAQVFAGSGPAASLGGQRHEVDPLGPRPDVARVVGIEPGQEQLPLEIPHQASLGLRLLEGGGRGRRR